MHDDNDGSSMMKTDDTVISGITFYGSRRYIYMIAESAACGERERYKIHYFK